MNNLNNTNYDIDLSDGVITFKNINTTLGFVRYNETAEVEYIFVGNKRLSKFQGRSVTRCPRILINTLFINFKELFTQRTDWVLRCWFDFSFFLNNA